MKLRPTECQCRNDTNKAESSDFAPQTKSQFSLHLTFTVSHPELQTLGLTGINSKERNKHAFGLREHKNVRLVVNRLLGA
jgi:hypothetical protein